MKNEMKSINAKPVQRFLKVEISKGISKSDAIRIMEKTILAIGNNKTSWDMEFNNFVVLLEETDSDDGIHVAKQITWCDIKRKKAKISGTCQRKFRREIENTAFPVSLEYESATAEECRGLNQDIIAA